MATAANDRGPRAEEAHNPDRWKGVAEPNSPLALGLDALNSAAPGSIPGDSFPAPGELTRSL